MAWGTVIGQDVAMGRWRLGVIVPFAIASLVLLLHPDCSPSARATEPASPSTSNPPTAMTIPWAVGGPRFERDGTLADFPGEWPDIPISEIRLWDTRTAWLNVEPLDGRWDFTRLDAFVSLAESKGVERIMLVLAGTPRWAAARTSPLEAPWLGPGSASPPRSTADWLDYVTTVATRYAGRIDAYEVWNEPTSQTFWNGSPNQWATLVREASRAISATDPDAEVLASGFSVSTDGELRRLPVWLNALGRVNPGLDALSIHWYPRPGGEADLPTTARRVRAMASRAGLPTALAITEVNVRGGSGLSPARQMRAVWDIRNGAVASGIAELIWYAWSNLVTPELMLLQAGSPAIRALSLEVRPAVGP